jgi:hypothetical protein
VIMGLIRGRGLTAIAFGVTRDAVELCCVMTTSQSSGLLH